MSVAAVAVLCLAGIFYAPSLSRALVWDDHGIVGGSVIGGGARFADCFTKPFMAYYYRPLVSAGFYLERLVFGVDPRGYHVTNLLLHLLTVALVVAIGQKLFRSRLAGLAAGILFALHPVRTGAVAWMGGRTDTQSSLFAAIFLWQLLVAAECDGTGRKRAIFWSLFAYAGAVFTKEQCLPLGLLAPVLLESKPFGGGWFGQRIARAAASFGGVAALYIVCARSVAWPPASLVAREPLEHAMLAGATLAHYAQILLVPTHASVLAISLDGSDVQGIQAFSGFSMAACFLAVLGIAARRSKAIFTALLFLGLSMAPVLNLIPHHFLQVAPYRASLAAIPLALLAGAGVAQLARWTGNTRSEALGLAGLLALGAWTGWLGGLTVWNRSLYRDEVLLFETVSAWHPRSIVSRYVLTQCYTRQGTQERSAPVAERMLDLIFGGLDWRSAEGLKTAMNDARARRLVLQNQGTRNAPEVFVGQVLLTLGYSRIARGELVSAEVALSLSERLPGNESLVHLAQGFLAMRQGRLGRAVERLEMAARLLPNNPWPREYLAQVYKALEQPELAARQRAEVERLATQGYTLSSTW